MSSERGRVPSALELLRLETHIPGNKDERLCLFGSFNLHREIVFEMARDEIDLICSIA
jgi:hypothetical protein